MGSRKLHLRVDQEKLRPVATVFTGGQALDDDRFLRFISADRDTRNSKASRFRFDVDHAVLRRSNTASREP